MLPSAFPLAASLSARDELHAAPRRAAPERIWRTVIVSVGAARVLTARFANPLFSSPLSFYYLFLLELFVALYGEPTTNTDWRFAREATGALVGKRV